MFVTLEPRRLYRQVADQIRVLIEAGELVVGGRLPAERDLYFKAEHRLSTYVKLACHAGMIVA